MAILAGLWAAITAASSVVALSRLVPPFPTAVCSTIAPPQSVLNVTTASTSVDHHPFGIKYLTNDIAFAVIGRTIGVLDTSQFKPVLKYQIHLTHAIAARLGFDEDDPDTEAYIFHGLAITNDGRNLYAAGGYGAIVIDTQRAVAGRNDSIVGVLANDGRAGNYSAMVSITPDDQYVFFTQEFGSPFTFKHGSLEVWNVFRAEDGAVTGVYKGFIILGFYTVDLAFSHDYSKLYVTNEIGGLPASSNDTVGSVAVLDVAKLKQSPASSLLWAVDAGCHPVRVKLSPDGKNLWVNAREGNELLVFDTEMLNSNDTLDRALVTTIQTGTSPVAVAVVGSYVFTADSNRFGYSNTTSGLTVVNTQEVLQEDEPVRFPQIPMGSFPREFGVSPDGKTLLVSEYDGYEIRAVDIGSLKGRTDGGRRRFRVQRFGSDQ
ncbi:uncharacterized protein JN550_007731 [Neoarthrinium moseri]|uniref:uncharacterized protein n=1 Tax=Neoarthrinium moseri TaxID=1658444 RepID=UPI001FDBA6CF|nr:uncharacterized protein JN550_007731 [Neoarthrinium moseri]KAI1866343.1 hypothetical protein JN550_007731 [Neoarthrinium moseri]